MFIWFWKSRGWILFWRPLSFTKDVCNFVTGVCFLIESFHWPQQQGPGCCSLCHFWRLSHPTQASTSSDTLPRAAAGLGALLHLLWKAFSVARRDLPYPMLSAASPPEGFIRHDEASLLWKMLFMSLIAICGMILYQLGSQDSLVLDECFHLLNYTHNLF